MILGLTNLNQSMATIYILTAKYYRDFKLMKDIPILGSRIDREYWYKLIFGKMPLIIEYHCLYLKSFNILNIMIEWGWYLPFKSLKSISFTYLAKLKEFNSDY